jgi:Ni,Fe-hydrogenase I cytochrome b subunit
MTSTFRRFAGTAAMLAATASVAYTVTFALFVRRGYHWAHWASALVLMVSGLIATPVFMPSRVGSERRNRTSRSWRS